MRIVRGGELRNQLRIVSVPTIRRVKKFRRFLGYPFLIFKNHENVNSIIQKNDH